MSDRIRAVALCVFRRDNDILVVENLEPNSPEGKTRFYRPVGGRIEYGEYSREAVIREVKEEIDAEMVNLRLLATIENIFTYQGAIGHEISRIYEADLADQSLYEQPWIRGIESNGEPFRAVWISLASLQAGPDPLYPTGLLDVLTRS